MDASDHDFEAKLYKAAGDIIPELLVKLPKLIWHHGSDGARLRTHVLLYKCEELRTLLDRFQEWPQLLDPCLAFLVKTAVDGFLEIITKHRNTYLRRSERYRSDVIPLPRALSRILYTLCKVRGYKVIVRLLNNEPRYIEPLLSCLRVWGKNQDQRPKGSLSGMEWEERYVMLLWLSHLMLAPFELSSLSTQNVLEADPALEHIFESLSPVAVDVLSIAFEALKSPSKERESAVIAIVRLALRRDMQKENLPSKLVSYSTQKLLSNDPQHTLSVHYALGCLALLYSITNLGSDSEVVPFLGIVHKTTASLLTSRSSFHQAILDSAPVRKLLVKIMRVTMTHAIAMRDKDFDIGDDALNLILEDGIQYFLDALGDKDSPVRMSASKALSMVTLKLEVSMSAEVVEAVLATLSENVLVREYATNGPTAITDLLAGESPRVRKNLSAVDPLKWHGSMLTLGHLLFRRSPPPYQLPEIVEALLLGLEFEQRSNVGTSVGVGVRDAACFGIWSLSRKYSSSEIGQISIDEISGTVVESSSAVFTSLQHIAVRLVISACFDPSGNIRRGSSAALQELIGRHPDTIVQGIALVQTVDYHAVARRSKAMTEVALQAATLDSVYHKSLLQALLDWHGATATDPESRRWAAASMATLSVASTDQERFQLLSKIANRVQDLKHSNLGSNASARHGLLLCLSATIESFTKSSSETRSNVLSKVQNLQIARVTGNMGGRVTTDLEMVMEGVSGFIAAVSRLGTVGRRDSGEEEHEAMTERWVKAMLPLLNRCTIACERDFVVSSSAQANVALFKLMAEDIKIGLLKSWLSTTTQKTAERLCKGRLISIGFLYSQVQLDQKLQARILDFVRYIIEGNENIETRTNAMECLCTILQQSVSISEAMSSSFSSILISGLTDYTSDQRGDIGSHLRLQSLEAVNALLGGSAGGGGIQERALVEVTPYVVRLAAEKLNKVRFQAWLCLRGLWRPSLSGVQLAEPFLHLSDVSSEAYYRQLMELLRLDGLQEQLIIGLSTSATGSTDEIGRACCSAFAAFILAQSPDVRAKLTDRIAVILLKHLDTMATKDDRVVLPALEFLTFMIEQNFIPEHSMLGEGAAGSDVWSVMQKVQTATSSMVRVETATKLYSALTISEPFRAKALDKLTRQLLHRWPKIRNGAADSLYLNYPDDSLISCDWNAPVANNKPAVLELRRFLNIAKALQAKG